MEWNIWNEFYREVNKLEIIKQFKDWADKNDVQFEPYARAIDENLDWVTNQIKCTCCFNGMIDDKKDYLFLKIGNNGKWDFDAEEKELKELLEEYKEALDYLYIAWNLSKDKLENFCNEFNLIKPNNKYECIKNNKVKEIENTYKKSKADYVR